MQPVNFVTTDAVETAFAQECTKFVKSAPYHTESQLRSALVASIREAVAQIDPVAFLVQNPEAGEWFHTGRFGDNGTTFGALRSAVGERIWKKISTRSFDSMVRC